MNPFPKPAKRAKKGSWERKTDDGWIDERERQREYLNNNPRCEVVIKILNKDNTLLREAKCNKKAFEVDHIEPKKMGGSYDPYIHSDDNKQSICRFHHQLKHGVIKNNEQEVAEYTY